MIHTKDSKRSLVIPKWLSLHKAWTENENKYFGKSKLIINPHTINEIELDYEEFKVNPSVANAADLLSSAFVIERLEIAKHAALFLEEVPNLHPETRKLVNRVLYGKRKIISDNLENINNDINKIRNKLKLYPKNPLFWIEIARLFTIRGHTRKARNAVNIALTLAPYERYIVRSGFRFFIHNDEFDVAHYYAKRAADYSADPWLKSLEVNAAILNNFNLSKIKKFNTKTIPNKELYNYSEWIESIGMIELNYGNESKAKKNFKLAWTDPSLNVIAHGEWILRNRFPALPLPAGLDFSKSFEATSWRFYYNLELENAIFASRSWILEEPYSSHPYLLNSSILCLNGNLKESITISKSGLITNPNDLSLKNNLAYSHLLANDLKEAESILHSFPINIPDQNRIFYLATKGLLAYKKNDILLGRSLYSESIELCNKLKEPDLALKALMNLTLMELELHTNKADSLSQQALLLSKDSNDPAVQILRKKIIGSISLKNEYDK